MSNNKQTEEKSEKVMTKYDRKMEREELKRRRSVKRRSV